MSFRRLVPLLTLTVLAGCSAESHGPRLKQGESQSEVQPALAVGDEECAIFAQSLVKAVKEQDAAQLAKLMDWNALLGTASRNITAPDKTRLRFVADMKGDAKKPGLLPRQFLDLISRGGEYKFLRRHAVGNQARLVFRLALPDGAGLNYHDVVLDRAGDGGLKGADVYIFTNGELLSQTARRAFLTTVLRQEQVPVARLEGVEREFQLHFTKVELMNDFERAGQYQQVLKLYDQLPTELQRDKNVMLIRLRAAQNLGGAEYSEAIENLRTFHPDDPSIDLFSITYFLNKKDAPKALEMIDRVDSAVGSDPYLNVLRSDVYLAVNNASAAREAAHTALEEDPTLLEAQWALIAVSLREKNFDETLELLRDIERRFAPRFPDMKALPIYAEFIKSSQYQEWLKSRKSP
jgi:tetratricopeptide (TPR) repeat protein